MDWLHLLMPISGVEVFWPGLIILGLGVGIIGGFFGMGGGWMVTPGLNMLGFPMAFAIGTDISHMAGKSLISTMRHAKFGNVDYKLGLIMTVGTVAGVEAGVLGIGGGLIRMPALVYLVGCPTHIAIGTDLFEVMISALYGCATYTAKGRTELLAALIMLLGASVGAQIGSIATKYLKGYGIRVLFGVAVVGCAVSIVLKLIAGANPALKTVFDQAAAALILCLLAALSLIIFMKFLNGVRKELAEQRKQ
jgi:uncharacterized membrane protein YfcA